MVRVTIGILAWNEADVIVRTLESLFSQLLFRKIAPTDYLEVIVVPNGSTDKTAERAREYLSTLEAFAKLQFGAKPALLPSDSSSSQIAYSESSISICDEVEPLAKSSNLASKASFAKASLNLAAPVSCRVEPLATPGKANAWNRLVHELADPKSDYFILMDADIEINQPDTLGNMIKALEQDLHAVVSTDVPQKHIQFKKIKNPVDVVLEAMGGLTRKAKAQLCGQLYCLRGPFARRTWLPTGLVIEDGFLKELIVTNGYCELPDNSKIISAENASHVFTAYTRLREIFRHQQRQAIGQTMNYTLKLWLMEGAKNKEVAKIIQEENQRDPNWLIKLVRDHRRHWWNPYPGALSHRFTRLKQASPWRRLMLFPIAFGGFLFDIPVFFTAYKRLGRAQATQDLWKKN